MIASSKNTRGATISYHLALSGHRPAPVGPRTIAASRLRTRPSGQPTPLSLAQRPAAGRRRAADVRRVPLDKERPRPVHHHPSESEQTRGVLSCGLVPLYRQREFHQSSRWRILVEGVHFGRENLCLRPAPRPAGSSSKSRRFYTEPSRLYSGSGPKPWYHYKNRSTTGDVALIIISESPRHTFICEYCGAKADKGTYHVSIWGPIRYLEALDGNLTFGVSKGDST